MNLLRSGLRSPIIDPAAWQGPPEVLPLVESNQVGTVTRRLLIVCLLSIAPSFSICASSQERSARLDEFVAQANRYRLFNGVILIAEKGEVVYTKAVGLANMEWDVPHGLDSKFRLASISKQFTCMLILQLVEEGKVSLDGKITDYLPDYPIEQGSKVSIRNLMSHTSGIPNYTDFDDWYSELWIREYSTEEFLELFSHLDLEFVPGSRFEYSNSGYHVLAAIVEAVRGKPFNEVMNERIFQPLEMTDSGCIDINTVVPRMSFPYEYWDFRFTRSDYFNPTTAEGAGSVYSTAPDLWKWHRALIGSRLISPELTREMMTEQIHTRNSLGYGFGLVVGRERIDGVEHDFVGHSGAYPGYNSLFAWFPRSERLLVILNNTGHTRLDLLRDETMKILEGGDFHLRPPLPVLLSEASSIAEIERLISRYRASPAEFECQETQLRRLGRKLVAEQRAEAGLRVLEFNAESYPGSSPAHRELGWAYRESGQLDKARSALRRSLELDPDNESARAILEAIAQQGD